MSWVQTFVNESKVKQALIISGNVRDEFWNTNANSYQHIDRYLHDTLLSEQYLMVLRWNKVDGIHFTTTQDVLTYDQLISIEVEENSEEEEFDLGQDFVPQRNISLVRKKEFTELIREFQLACSRSSQPIGLIINWGDYLMNQQMLQPEERDQLLRLGQFSLETSLRQEIVSSEVTNPSSILVIITSNIASIPHSFYEPDPRVRVLNIPKPDLEERRKYLNRHFHDFQFKKGDGVKTKNPEQLIEYMAALTDQLTLADLRMIMELSHQINTKLEPEDLVNLYKLGERESPWEQLDENRLRELKDHLNSRVIGQEEAIDHVVTTIIKASLGLSGLQHSSKLTKPKGTLFFVGPTGVGKTELAKGIAEFLFGDESACIRFDMSEYKQEQSDQKLIGAPPGYVGFENGGQLTNSVMEKPFSVLLFDEIEKAHERILDIFLGILEDGRLTDGRGETAYFSETLIIFTSNLGASGEAKGDIKEDRRNYYISAIEHHFVDKLGRPEILNRLGENIVVFNNITDVNFKTMILKKKLTPLHESVREKFGIHLSIDETVYHAIVMSSDPKYGGRGILNIADRMLMNPLSDFLFKNKIRLTQGRTVAISWEDQNLKMEIKE